jgi:hypothetical protein
MRLLVGAVGIEPTTFGLKGRCSTTELRPWRANSQHASCTAERHGRHRTEFKRLLILACGQETSNRGSIHADPALRNLMWIRDQSAQVISPGFSAPRSRLRFHT